jgi:prepilin-type processing-associated H-X9-DG protein
MDFIAGRLDARAEDEVRRRLESEPALSLRCESLRRTFAALDMLTSPEPPADLMYRTLDRVKTAGRYHVPVKLQGTGRGVFCPTFSRWELAVVAAVILIMVGILIPSFLGARLRGQRNQCAVQMGQIGSAMHTYALNNNGLLPGVQSDSDRWLGGEKVASNSAALFKLLSGGYVNRPVDFQCPAVGGASFSLERDMSDFPRAENISYSYHHSIGRQLAMDCADNMAVMGDQTPLFKDNRFRPKLVDSAISENHDRSGQNVWYLDGHVQWAAGPDAGVEGDNIYLVGNIRKYNGDEVPSAPTDTFLLPAWNGRK